MHRLCPSFCGHDPEAVRRVFSLHTGVQHLCWGRPSHTGLFILTQGYGVLHRLLLLQSTALGFSEAPPSFWSVQPSYCCVIPCYSVAGATHRWLAALASVLLPGAASSSCGPSYFVQGKEDSLAPRGFSPLPGNLARPLLHFGYSPLARQYGARKRSSEARFQSPPF